MRTSLTLASALALASLAATGVSAQSGPAEKPSYKFEKCYGVVEAAKNDCQTANSSCAGTSKRDNQGDAWIYLPAGTCDKLAGGSLQPKQS